MPNGRQCPANFYRHTIQPGDTVSNIANYYGISLASLLLSNRGINPYNLIVGTYLCIPAFCPVENRIYTVKAGDTLYKIAAQFNVSVQQITKSNPRINPNNLRVGQRLCIPALCPKGFSEYTIRQGDTLYALALRYNTTIQELLDVNPMISDAESLRIGQKICVPEVCPAGFTDYTIMRGDTLYALALRYNTTIQELLDVNPLISDPESLRVGQKICVPEVCPEGFTDYTIMSGDTLYALAVKYNTTVQDILDVNPLITDPGSIRVGQKICVPIISETD